MFKPDMKHIIKIIPLIYILLSFAIPQSYSSPDTETLYPEGVGSYTEFPYQFPDSGFHWQKVDEIIPDEASTFIYSSIDDTGTYIDTFTVQDTSIEEGSTINSVTVYIRERSIATTGNLKGYSGTEIISHSTLYEGTFALASSTWSYKTTVYTVNPFTSAEWTLEEINAIEIGGKGRSRYDSKNGEWTTADITQCKIVIDYSPPVVGEWHNVESWYGELITRQWASVESWYGTLISRAWTSVENWSGTLITRAWMNVEIWYGRIITEGWQIIESWGGMLKPEFSFINIIIWILLLAGSLVLIVYLYDKH